MKTFFISTLGCKVNQYESDGIAMDFIRQGWQQVETSEEAQVCIINTCAVTSKAAMQSRQEIRRIIRSNPNTFILAAGCHAQTEPERIQEIDTVHWIAGHEKKFNLVKAANDLLASGAIEKESHPLPVPSRTRKILFHLFPPAVKGKKTRAYLKIQDGCNAACTYCIVPSARGRSTSMPPKDVIRHLEFLAESGFKEAVLTGIHVGSYGLDLVPHLSLSMLLQKIYDQKPIHRLRLSSIEPNELSDVLLDTAKKAMMICDHFHIPLQSGDNDVLRRMGRPYDSDFFRKLILKIRRRFPYAAIGVDILIGFPGESEKAFETTFALIESIPVSYLHVFPFSPRPGTPAFGYPDKVPEKAIKRRSQIMRSLGNEKKRQFQLMNIGVQHEAVVQHERDAVSGRLVAMTSNYLSILIDGHDSLKGEIVNVILEVIDSEDRLIGRMA